MKKIIISSFIMLSSIFTLDAKADRLDDVIKNAYINKSSVINYVDEKREYRDFSEFTTSLKNKLNTNLLDLLRSGINKDIYIVSGIKTVSLDNEYTVDLVYDNIKMNPSEYLSTEKKVKDKVKKDLLLRKNKIEFICEMSSDSSTQYMEGILKAIYNDRTRSGNDGNYIEYILKQYSTKGSYIYGNLVKIEFLPKYRESLAQTKYVDKEVEKIIKSLKFTKKTSTKDKVIKVHNIVSNIISYDKSFKNFTAYDGLKTGKAVCQGYSLLMYNILQKVGVDCMIVSGKGINGTEEELHAWNLVKVGKKWYHVDVTFDTPVTNTGQKVTNTNYLLKGTKDFKNHKMMSKPKVKIATVGLKLN